MNKKGHHKGLQNKVTELTVEKENELLEFLLEKLSNRSRNSVKSILARGQVSVGGQIQTKYNFPLAPGQKVNIRWGGPQAGTRLQGLTILHEDDDIIVIEKSAGLLSIATEKEKGMTAYRQLMDHVRDKHPNQRIFIVHRLDRDTSGLMLFAKSKAVQEQLQNHWKEAVLERTYVALVEGEVNEKMGTIKSWFKESATHLVYSSQNPNEGKEAITHYKVLKSNRKFSLLEVNLETGRKNQIRVHMKDIGHPVVGDKKYGSNNRVIGRLGLHARQLSFKHPRTGEVLRFATKIPEAFSRPFN
ncbi:MAG: RluA family pseudouridine synthase [Tuberibacillus sp.]